MGRYNPYINEILNGLTNKIKDMNDDEYERWYHDQEEEEEIIQH